MWKRWGCSNLPQGPAGPTKGWEVLDAAQAESLKLLESKTKQENEILAHQLNDKVMEDYFSTLIQLV